MKIFFRIFYTLLFLSVISVTSYSQNIQDTIYIASWNVENLFDILDPHPVDPPLPRKAEYELSFAQQFDKIIVNDILEKAVQETYTGVKEFLDYVGR